MQDDGSSICLLTKGGVSYSRRSEQNVILLQYNILRSTAVLLTAMQQNVISLTRKSRKFSAMPCSGQPTT